MNAALAALMRRMSLDLEPAAADAPSQTPAGVRAELEVHHGAAWRWALACCRGERDAAQDLLHDAYVTVLSGRARFEGRSSFKTWLFGVIRVSAMARRRRNLFFALLFEPIGPRAEAIASPAPANAAASSRRLDAILNALPRRQLEIVSLVFGHDLTIEGAARVMNISVGAARQHHARAKAKLRAGLATENRHG